MLQKGGKRTGMDEKTTHPVVHHLLATRAQIMLRLFALRLELQNFFLRNPTPSHPTATTRETSKAGEPDSDKR